MEQVTETACISWKATAFLLMFDLISTVGNPREEDPDKLTELSEIIHASTTTSLMP